ncbi:tRNA (adenine37-N(6))-methyltransferase TrmN6 [Rubellimicrobium mesophilum DSM 19309]|uniref:tRNA (Adenine37-N(6))-methyltransferase TrmN6 n=1 Tax=Rubellimicrobium mesophilum DSM 19309 TaxID=442562 RepID=A0A017HR66_9RHOB|nr:methyltransferase [Rubellimicrobium mesophilum]EYD76871.1 tRNA (adenine37-N(6))-methyltransferase TrmN6 [Rubellimicrobium mesophilum DSM 19309]
MSDLTEDDFLGGRLRLRQPSKGFRSGMDAMLLAAAVPARPGESALELGCGAGAAILALGARVPGLTLAGLELQPAYAALACANAALNGFALEVIEGDVAQPPPGLRARAVDHVLMNPPYYDRAASTRAEDPGRDLAHGGPAPLSAWLALAGRRLRPGGILTLIQPTARLPEALAGLPATLGSAEILPLAPRPGHEPRLILLRARKGGRAPFRLLPSLPLHDGPPGPDGKDFAPWAVSVLRGGTSLPWP